MKVTHLVILIVFLLVVLQILRKNKNKKKYIQLIKNNLYSELKKRNDKNQNKINELEELLRKEQRRSFYLTVFTVMSIFGLSIYIYMLIRKNKEITIKNEQITIKNEQITIKNEQFISYLKTLSEASTKKYPFKTTHNEENQVHEINIFDDARNLSQEISKQIGLNDVTEKQILTNDIRKFQLDLAKTVLNFPKEDSI